MRAGEKVVFLLSWIFVGCAVVNCVWLLVRHNTDAGIAWACAAIWAAMYGVLLHKYSMQAHLNDRYKAVLNKWL